MQHAREPSGKRGGVWLLLRGLALELPLEMKLTSHRNVPKMEEATNVAHSDCTAWGEKRILLLTSVH